MALVLLMGSMLPLCLWCSYSIGHDSTSQMLFAYSAMVRSLENLPDAAMFRIALRDQRFLVGVKLAQPRVRFAVALEVGQVQVVVAFAQQRVENRREHARLVLAEMIARR